MKKQPEPSLFLVNLFHTNLFEQKQQKHLTKIFNNT